MKRILSVIAVSLIGLALSAQTKITVSGTVLDENGQPLPGLTVLVENSTNGTITDADGKYTLKVNDNSVLVFDCLGYRQHKELVAKRTVINVSMEVDKNLLDEVVVVGYGTMKKSDLKTMDKS